MKQRFIGTETIYEQRRAMSKQFRLLSRTQRRGSKLMERSIVNC